MGLDAADLLARTRIFVGSLRPPRRHLDLLHGLGLGFHSHGLGAELGLVVHRPRDLRYRRGQFRHRGCLYLGCDRSREARRRVRHDGRGLWRGFRTRTGDWWIARDDLPAPAFLGGRVLGAGQRVLGSFRPARVAAIGAPDALRMEERKPVRRPQVAALASHVGGAFPKFFFAQSRAGGVAERGRAVHALPLRLEHRRSKRDACGRGRVISHRASVVGQACHTLVERTAGDRGGTGLRRRWVCNLWFGGCRLGLLDRGAGHGHVGDCHPIVAGHHD